MNAYQTAQAKGITGTDSQIVAVLQTLTVSDIPITSVQSWFREKNLWMPGPGLKRLGTLEAVYSNPATPSQAIDGLDYLWATVFGGSALSLRTTDPEWAVKVWQLVQLVVSLSPGASGLVGSFYALDGGRPFKDLTVEQYTAAVAASESLDAKQTALQLAETAVEAAREEFRKAESTPESIIAAAVAVLGGG